MLNPKLIRHRGAMELHDYTTTNPKIKQKLRKNQCR